MPEWDPKRIESLIAGLASADSFARLAAIEELSSLTNLSLGFRFNSPSEDRSQAIERWNRWWKEQQREKEKEKLQAAIHLTGGALDLGALKKAIKEIPAEKIQGYLNALLLKMKSPQTRCDACSVRPATVQITELRAGRVRTRHLCDTCAQERGDILV